MSDGQGAGLFPAAVTSVQELETDGLGLNRFTLVQDLHLVDGYEHYEGVGDADAQFVRFLRGRALPNDGLKIEREWTERHDASVARSQKLYDEDPTLLKRDPLYVEVDDAYNL